MNGYRGVAINRLLIELSNDEDIISMNDRFLWKIRTDKNTLKICVKMLVFYLRVRERYNWFTTSRPGLVMYQRLVKRLINIGLLV